MRRLGGRRFFGVPLACVPHPDTGPRRRRARRGGAGRGRRPARQPRRLLHRRRALSERLAARQGQPRAGGRRPRRQDPEHRPDARRPGRRAHEDHRRGLSPAAPRHEGGHPAGLAVRRGQSLHRPPAPGGRPPGDDPGRRRHRPVRHDDGGRPRPALQHLRPQDAQGAERPHPRLRRLLRRQGRGGQRRLGLPEPVAGGLQPALQGARLRHARAQALHRRVLAAGGRSRDAPR